MKCKKCGNEFSGNVCPHCGTPAPKQTSQKDNGTLCMILGILGLVFTLSCFGWILAIVSIVVGMKCKDTQTPGRRKIGLITSIITLGLTVIILIAAAFSGDDSATEASEQVETVTEIASAETEISSSETETIAETETVPEANTSAMVDYIAAEAKKSANQAATDEKRDEAIEYIFSHYPNYFDDNETMEKTMYYGYYLEYAYEANDPSNVYANLGMDADQAVKYVYRGTETIEDDHVTENLRQIAVALSSIGYDVENEATEAEQTASQTAETVSPESTSPEAAPVPTESSPTPTGTSSAQTDAVQSAPESVEQNVEPQSSTVYWTPNGKSYHTTSECSTLSRSKTILSGTIDEAMAAGKTDPCNVCH